MRLLFAALRIVAAIAAAANLPDSIRNADRRSGHKMVELSRIVAWPTFERAAIRWPDPAAIERAIGEERSAAYARLVVGRRLTP
jgi:hypothetical protein